MGGRGGVETVDERAVYGEEQYWGSREFPGETDLHARGGP